MKTAEDLGFKIANLSDEGFDQIKCEEILIEWEQEIRKEQDKITRHACTEGFMTLEIGYYRGALDEFRSKAQQTIMNTKAV